MIEWLTDTLVMTGALMALVLLVRRPVGRWFGPGAAYALWALPMIRLVLPPLALPRELLPRPEISVEPMLAAVPVAEPMIGGEQLPAVPVPSGVPADAGLLEQVPWTGLLLAIWLGGAAAFLAWRTYNYFTVRRELLANAVLVAHAEGVRIVESPAAAAPLAFGVFDKVVALPSGFLADTASENSDFAITHELEHHAGNDLLAVIAMQPLFALHWFNPLAWLAWRALRSDQEAACDARVMAGRDRETRARYGRLIASYAAGTRLALAAPIAGPLAGDKPIIHRLKALACMDVSPARSLLARSLFAASIVTVPLTATVSYAAIETPEAPPEATEVPLPPAPPEAPRPPEVPANIDAVQPPVPPSRPAREADARRRQDEAERMSANAEHRAAEVEHRAAEARRRVAQAMASAPQVERTVSADGKIERIRIIQRDEKGRESVTQDMVLDGNCPAGSQSREARGGRTAEIICTGEPQGVHEMALKALRSARASIVANRNIEAAVRSEILSEIDAEIERAHKEMAAHGG